MGPHSRRVRNEGSDGRSRGVLSQVKARIMCRGVIRRPLDSSGAPGRLWYSAKLSRFCVVTILIVMGRLDAHQLESWA